MIMVTNHTDTDHFDTDTDHSDTGTDTDHCYTPRRTKSPDKASRASECAVGEA